MRLCYLQERESVTGREGESPVTVYVTNASRYKVNTEKCDLVFGKCRESGSGQFIPVETLIIECGDIRKMS